MGEKKWSLRAVWKTLFGGRNEEATGRISRVEDVERPSSEESEAAVSSSAPPPAEPVTTPTQESALAGLSAAQTGGSAAKRQASGEQRKKSVSGSTASNGKKETASKRAKALQRETRVEVEKPQTLKVRKSDAARIPSQFVDRDARPIQLEQVFLNLGIDFGTSFTKVCFRDSGTEETFPVLLSHETDDGLLTSAVSVAADGTLYLMDEAPRGAKPVPYLKMRLAGVPIDGPPLPVVKGVDLASDEAVRAVASWFLAAVIMRSRAWISQNASGRLKNRIPVWSANVGVPVEHYDSPAISVFQEVLGAAWLWVADDDLPANVQEAVQVYRQISARLKGETTDIHAVPEIAAAVHSFVMSREASPGIYVYFDIGGGTVDGVAFKFLNLNGERRVNFYSGKVVPLGISALAAALGNADASSIDGQQLERFVRIGDPGVLGDFEQQLRRLVGYVVMRAKQIDGGNWQEEAVLTLPKLGKSIRALGGLDKSRMHPLFVFLGGGGSGSAWYRAAIGSTYDRFNHYNAGIPPYHLLEVAAPADFYTEDRRSVDFRRFAVSYGLSIPFGEGPEVGLPSQFAEAEALPTRTPQVVSYLDSKDAYD